MTEKEEQTEEYARVTMGDITLISSNYDIYYLSNLLLQLLQQKEIKDYLKNFNDISTIKSVGYAG